MPVNIDTPTLHRQGLRRWLPGSGDSSVDFLWAILALTLVRGVIYALLNPPFGSPDERDHLQYVEQLATAGASGPRGAEGHQPIPYYALMVPVYWLTAGQSPAIQDLAIRLAGLPFLLGVVLFTWLAGRKMAPGRPFVPVLAALFVGLHPQLAYIGASANNDNAANFAGAVLIYLVVTVLSQGAPRWAIPTTAFAIAAALMTKGQILPIVAICALVTTYVLIQKLRTGRSKWMAPSVVLAVVVIVVALSTTEGGHMRSTASWSLSLMSDWSTGREMLALTGMDPFPYLFTSFWGAFLGESVHPGMAWYAAPTALVLLSGAGYLSLLLRSRRGRHPASLGALLTRVTLAAAVAATFATVYLRYLVTYQNDTVAYRLQVLQGRFLFVALAPLALLVAEGLWAMAGKRTPEIALGAATVMAAFEIVCLLSLVGQYGWATFG